MRALKISLKYAQGKLTLGCNSDDLLKLADDMGFTKLSLTSEEAVLFYQLPKLAHMLKLTRQKVTRWMFG